MHNMMQFRKSVILPHKNAINGSNLYKFKEKMAKSSANLYKN